jgi:3-oxoadipate enol-lactonase
VVLIHGLGQGAWVWRLQGPFLARRWRVTTVDLPDSGTIPEFAAAVAGTMREPAHVVGLSMGGYVALTLAVSDPALVRSLVLVATGAGGPDRVPRPAHVVEAFGAAWGSPPEEYARATMPYAFSPGWTEREPARFEEILAWRLERPASYATIAAQIDACYRFYADGCEVERIEAPALVLHGDADLIVPVENGRALAARLPRSELVELPGRGHNLPLEDPETFDRLVEGFLLRVEARASSGGTADAAGVTRRTGRRRRGSSGR